MYEPRWYRSAMGERFRTLTCTYLETDMWIAFDVYNKNSDEEILEYTQKKIAELRSLFENYFKRQPQYKTTFEPLEALPESPEIIKRLSSLSFHTGVGPMAGIAGAFAEHIALSLKQQFHFTEIMLENGGDLYLDIKHKITVKLYAGQHPLSNKLNLVIDPEYSPLGLCASSGKFGHSYSQGKADLVAVACKDCILADQLATKYANEIKNGDDIQKVMDMTENVKELLHLSLFADEKFAIKGQILMQNA